MSNTLLTRFFEAGEQIPLSIAIPRFFFELQLIPTLGCNPSSGFSMFKDLLIDVKHLQMG